MKLEVDFWQFLGLGLSVLASFWGIARALLAQAQRNIDEKFKAISVGLGKQDESLAKQDALSRRIERDLMELKAQLPREYVRAENYIPNQAQLLTKLDQVHLRMEAFFTRVEGSTKS